MAEIKEKDWQYTPIQYGRDWMGRDAAVAPSPADTVTGGIGVNLAPRVGSGKTFTQAMLAHGSSFNGFTKGAFSMNSDGELVELENPYLKQYLTFKNVNGKNVASHTLKNFGSLESQLKNMENTDSSGPYSKTGMQGVALGFGASAGKLSSLAAGGVMAALMGATKGPKDPLTGEPVGQLIPMLSNAILKHKYDAIREIKKAILEQRSDVGDAFTLGGFSFVRKPGEYRFHGNLSAVGLSHEELHGLSAIARGFDPNSYDRDSGTGNRILTYGGTAGYMLDGRHVDYTGKISGAGIGTMRSDTWRAMVNKHFNGNNDIAQQWLAGTEKFRGWSGIKDVEAAQAWFNQMTGSAYGKSTDYTMHRQYLGTEQDIGNYHHAGYGVGSEHQYTAHLNGSKFVSPDHVQFLGEGGAGMEWSDFTALDLEDTEDTAAQSPFMGYGSLMTENVPETDAIKVGYQTYEGGLEEEMGTENLYRGFGAGFSDFAQGRPTRPVDFSSGYTDYMGRISNVPIGAEKGVTGLFPDANVTYPPYNFKGAGRPTGQITTPRPSEMNPHFPSLRTVHTNILSNAANNNAVNAESSSFSTIQEIKKNKASGGNTFTNLVASQTSASEWPTNRLIAAKRAIAEDAKKDKPVFSVVEPWDRKPTANDMGNPDFGVYKGANTGFNRGGRVGYQTGDVVQGQPQLPEVVGGQMPSQVPDQQTVADDQKDTLKEGTFVLNAPAVELAGERDVKDMVMNAFYSAREKGLPIGRTDNKLYERNVDVLLSKGEVTIPPELVKIIGLSKLRKLNNRGVREVERREAESKQSQAANFPSQMGGMPQFSGGDEVRYPRKVPTRIRENIMNLPEPSSNQDILTSQLNSSQLSEIFGSDSNEDPNVPVVGDDPPGIDARTPEEYWAKWNAKKSQEQEQEGFLNPPSNIPSDDVALQNAVKSMKVTPQTKIDYRSPGGIDKFIPYKKYSKDVVDLVYNSLHFAEWGEGYDKPEFHLGDYFTRTHTEPKEGSSAYGPLQITGGLLVAYFGTDEQLKDFGNTGPAGKFKEAYSNAGGKKDGSAIARSILNDEEKVFVDAMIDQAHTFLIYGNRPKKKGYNPTYDYGGRGDVFEKFPNYQQLYMQVAHKLIELSLDKADGDLIKTAKIWKEGRVGSPKTTFKDKEYLKRFKQGVQGERVKNEQPEIPSIPVSRP